MELLTTILYIWIIFIIIIILVWVIEIPALLVRICQDHDSWDQIFESAKLFNRSPFYLTYFAFLLLILGGSLAIVIIGLIVFASLLVALLPFLLLWYLWYQFGKIMLDMSDAIRKRFLEKSG